MSNSAAVPAEYTSPIFQKYYLPRPPRDFYRAQVKELLPMCGHEFETTDYHSAIRTVNNNLKLGLTEFQLQVLGLMLTALSQSERFGNSLYLAPLGRENSATHSLQSMPLVTELFTRAGCLDEERQTGEVIEARVLITLGILLHDMGEIFGELNTLDQRSTFSDLEENPLSEREIFKFTLGLACEAVHRGDFSYFYSSIATIKGQLNRTSKGLSGKDILQVMERFRSTSETSSIKETKEFLLGIFDIAETGSEMNSPFARFVHNAVKAIEHTQGTRHMTKFGVKEDDFRRPDLFYGEGMVYPLPGYSVSPFIPLSLADSSRLFGSFNYMEKGLDQLVKNATTPGTQRLASEICKTLYLTTAESLFSAPRVFDRRKTRADPWLVEQMASLSVPTLDPHDSLKIYDAIRERFTQRQLTLLQELRKQTTDHKKVHGVWWSITSLHPLESRARLIDLYYHAYTIGYLPTSSMPLALHEELPDELKRFPRKNWKEYCDPTLNLYRGPTRQLTFDL